MGLPTGKTIEVIIFDLSWVQNKRVEKNWSVLIGGESTAHLSNQIAPFDAKIGCVKRPHIREGA